MRRQRKSDAVSWLIRCGARCRIRHDRQASSGRRSQQRAQSVSCRRKLGETSRGAALGTWRSASTSTATAPASGYSTAAAAKPATARTSRRSRNSTPAAGWSSALALACSVGRTACSLLRTARSGSPDGQKQTVMQFAPDGRLLRTLGKPGVAGNGPDTFNSPSDVLVAPNGDIFVADGHGDYPVPKTNDRMVKFSKDGKFIKAWGHHGSAQGEFDVPAWASHGFRRPAFRRRPREQPNPDFQSGRKIPCRMESSSAGRAESISATTSSMWATRSRMKKRTRRSSKVSALAALRTAR